MRFPCSLRSLAELSDLETPRLDDNKMSTSPHWRNCPNFAICISWRIISRTYLHWGTLRRWKVYGCKKNFVRDLSTLAGARNLTHIYLYLNHVSNLWPLLKLKKLKEVHAANNPLSDETYTHHISVLLEKGVKVWSGYTIKKGFQWSQRERDQPWTENRKRGTPANCSPKPWWRAYPQLRLWVHSAQLWASRKRR